jgi:hypothetical protein
MVLGLLILSAVTLLLGAILPVWMFISSLWGEPAVIAGDTPLPMMLFGGACLTLPLGVGVFVWWVVTLFVVRSAVGRHIAFRG